MLPTRVDQHSHNENYAVNSSFMYSQTKKNVAERGCELIIQMTINNTHYKHPTKTAGCCAVLTIPLIIHPFIQEIDGVHGSLCINLLVCDYCVYYIQVSTCTNFWIKHTHTLIILSLNYGLLLNIGEFLDTWTLHTRIGRAPHTYYC